jgi:hypothetical protein
MSYSLWLPFLIGLLLLTIGVPIAALLPGPVDTPKSALLDSGEQEPLLADGVQPVPGGKPANEKRTILAQTFRKARDLWSNISGRRNFQILLSIFFAAALASSNSPLFPQYISKRYDWTFANAGYLLSIKAAVNITLLALIVPSVVKLLSSRLSFESGRINKLGAQVMLVISVLGVLLIAVSPNVPYLIFCMYGNFYYDMH